MRTNGMLAADGVDTDGSARGVLAGWRLGMYAVAAMGCVLLSHYGQSGGSAVSGIVIAAALAAIAIAMWHGAYDAVQAEPLLKPRLRGKWQVVFFAGYAGLIAMVLVGWWAFPLASLVLFLSYSAWHFGTEPERGGAGAGTLCGAFALGALPIVAACRWHGVAVKAIFAQMLGGLKGAQAHADAVTSALAWTFWPVLAVACVAAALGLLGRGFTRRAESLAVVVTTMLLFAWCDPLLAFAVYFCCWHTPEHLIATSLPQGSGATLMERIGSNLRAGLVPWMLSLALLGIVFAFGRQAVVVYRAEIFIVLSALTVPHMALNELGRWQRTHGDRAESLAQAGQPNWRRSEA